MGVGKDQDVTAWEYLGVVLMLPVAGLIIGGVMLIVSKDAAREDRRHNGAPAE